MLYTNNRKKWITNFQRLLAQGITDNDIILVKLLVITKGSKFECEDKICAAHLVGKIDAPMVWYVYDYAGSELFITVKNNAVRLGDTIVDNDDGSTTFYVITACCPVSSICSKSECRYIVKDKESDEIIARIEKRNEAESIAYTLNSRGVKTVIMYSDDDKSVSTSNKNM